MASVAALSDSKTTPSLAVTYEGDDVVLLQRMLPLIDTIEISPDAIARSYGKHTSLRPEVLQEYQAVEPEVNFVAHGVGLSIGSFDHWEEGYLRLLDELFAGFALQWHSEHLAYTVVAGENVGTMFALPRTEEALDLVCNRVRMLQERYHVPFLLEHVIHLLPDFPAQYTPAGFLNAITSRTGCGLLLDAYNLECDAMNQGFDVAAFLDELNLEPVRELHLAGGVQHKEFHLDIHSNLTSDRGLELGLEIIRRAPGLRVVTFEFLKEAIPLLGHDAICAELTRIRQAMQC